MTYLEKPLIATSSHAQETTPQLESKIAALEAKIVQLETRMSALKAKLAQLEARMSVLEGTNPPPPSPSALKHVTFVGGEVNAASLAVNNDIGLRAMLKEAGVKVHVVSKAGLASQSPGFIKAVTSNGGVPIVVMQNDDGEVLGTVPMITALSVGDAITKVIKGVP